MKLKEVFYMLGFKPSPCEYGYKVKSFELLDNGHIKYAQWLHPSESQKEIRQSTINELRKFLSEGDVAIDVGAHTGDSTIPIAIAVGVKGCVLALEPNKYVFPILRKNSTLNKEKTNIIPLMFAATEDDGDIIFEYSDSGFCNGGRHEGISKWKHGHAFNLKVCGKNLDRFLRKEYNELVGRIKYIKIDAEGYDLIVIKSIYKLISECMPYIKAEVFKHTSYEQRLELHRTLKDLGYRIRKVVEEPNYEGEIINENNIMQWKHYDIFCVPGVANKA